MLMMLSMKKKATLTMTERINSNRTTILSRAQVRSASQWFLGHSYLWIDFGPPTWTYVDAMPQPWGRTELDRVIAEDLYIGNPPRVWDYHTLQPIHSNEIEAKAKGCLVKVTFTPQCRIFKCGPVYEAHFFLDLDEMRILATDGYVKKLGKRPAIDGRGKGKASALAHKGKRPAFEDNDKEEGSASGNKKARVECNDAVEADQL